MQGRTGPEGGAGRSQACSCLPVCVGSVWSRRSGRHWPAQLDHVTGRPRFRDEPRSTLARCVAGLDGCCRGSRSPPHARRDRPTPAPGRSAASAAPSSTTVDLAPPSTTTTTAPPAQPITDRVRGRHQLRGPDGDPPRPGSRRRRSVRSPPILSAADLAVRQPRVGDRHRRHAPRTRSSRSGRRRSRSTRCEPGGFDAVSMANNHGRDYGASGLHRIARGEGRCRPTTSSSASATTTSTRTRRSPPP